MQKKFLRTSVLSLTMLLSLPSSLYAPPKPDHTEEDRVNKYIRAAADLMFAVGKCLGSEGGHVVAAIKYQEDYRAKREKDKE